MPDGPPERIGRYEITREIGRGGMGVVFLGHDTQLDRAVAVKALTDDFALDPERLGRFEREARVLASLSHGNIATVYGLEEQDGHRYLVMEFVEGHTLAERLVDGPLPVIEALTICSQIAAGVEAAHDAGVVHRDLKPGNVIIRPDGAVKVLDFGLARELAPRTSSTDIASAATAPQAMTREGVTIGTPGYMSPEQVRGMAIDRGTDNFAFGCVLFECLAGQLAFPGLTATDSIAAILEREPDWSALPDGTPPTVQLLLRRCLQKDRRRRLRDIGDARIEIEHAITDPTSTSLGLAYDALATTAGSRRRAWAIALPWALAVLAIAAVVVAWLRGGLGAPAPAQVARLSVSIPDDAPMAPWPFLRISQDGRTLMFRRQEGPTSSLVLRHLDLAEFVGVPKTTGATYPILSPDGQWLAYFQDDRLRKVSVRGGPSTTVCEAPNERGLDWGSDGTIVLAPRRTGGLVRVVDAGGTPEPITTADESGPRTSHRHPNLLPDGRGVLFTATTDAGLWDDAHLMVQPADGSTARVLLTGAAYGRYVATGHLVFQRENTLMAAPFDLEALDVTAPAVPVLENVTSINAGAPPQFTISRNGTLVYMTGEANQELELVEVPFDGKATPIGAQTARFDGLDVSPDERRLAVEIEDDGGRGSIHILERDRDLLRPLTTGDHDDENPVWSPDGAWIVFTSDRDGVSNLYRVRSDFTGTTERLTTSDRPQFAWDWSPDGRSMLLAQREENNETDILVLRFDASGAVTGEPEPLLVRPGWQWAPSYSPDGRWIVYSSTEFGSPNVYVMPADGGGAEQISTDIGFIAAWVPGENRILFTDGFARPLSIRSVSYTIEDGALRPALPEPVLELEGAGRVDVFRFAADGRSVLMSRELDRSAERREPVIVLNWFEELRERTSSLDAGP